jgi:ABC-2 type transport system permease protein
MRATRTWVAVALTGRLLLRNRVAMALLVILPLLFYALIAITTGKQPTPFILSAVSETTRVVVPRDHEGLVFMGLAAVGFVSAFLGFHLIARQEEASRRLVLCGYRPWQLVLARLAALLIAVVAVSVISCVMLRGFFAPAHLLGTFVGLVLVGLVYGCYGLLAGALFPRELEGILSIVLLTNVDLAWLQNPVYYTEAQNRAVIRALPGYWPAQAGMIASFSDHSISRAAVMSLLYAAALLVVAVSLFWRRMHLHTATDARGDAGAAPAPAPESLLPRGSPP